MRRSARPSRAVRPSTRPSGPEPGPRSRPLLGGFLAATLLVAGALGVASAARAADGAAPPGEVQAWRGRYCTPLGCGPPRPASFASVAGFGLAAFGAAALARRR